MLTFRPLSSLKSGHLFEMLVSSYRDLIEKYDAKNKEKYLESWKQSDRDAFDNMETIGKCVLISYLEDKPIGFFSWDPRNLPEYGIVGQNCVLPEYKDKGYGKMQIEELLKIFRNAKCKKALVSTGDNEFFIPAQKMYQSLGFIEIGKRLNEKWGFNEIEYEKTIV